MNSTSTHGAGSLLRRFARLGTALVALMLPALVFAQQLPGNAKTERRASAEDDELDQLLLDGLDAGIPPRSERAQSPEGHGDKASTLDNGTPSGGAKSRDGSDVSPRNPLLQIGNQMRRVEQLLQQRQLSLPTQRSQDQIVAQLDQLIAALSDSQQKQQQSKRNSSSAKQQPTSKNGNQAARKPSGTSNEKGADAQEPPTPERVLGQFWGHLPERYRRQMQSAEAIEFLPKYRKLIEEYYKRLAEDRAIRQ